MATSTSDTFATDGDDELRDAGFDEKQARAIIASQQSARAELAPKADLAGLRTAMYREPWIQGVGVIVILTAPRCRCGSERRQGGQGQLRFLLSPLRHLASSC